MMSKGKMDKPLALKIIVPLVVVLLVGGVFLLKRTQVPSPTQTPVSSAGAAKGVAAGSPASPAASNDLLITTAIDFKALRSSGLPVIVDFGADSCIPCKEMAPVLADLNKSLEGKAIIRFVDVWKYRELAEGIPLQVIPTQIFFDSTGKPFTPSEKLQLPFTIYSLKNSGEHVFTTHEGALDKPQMLAILKEMGMK
jgi:thioredoxin 1